MTRIPVTRSEWQDAADAARALLVLDAARQYGLVAGGPVVHVDRCRDMIAGAARHGVTPAPDAVEQLVAELGEQGKGPA